MAQKPLNCKNAATYGWLRPPPSPGAPRLPVARAGKREVGLSFKPGTDDPREPPMVELAERLLGANREYIEQRLPRLGSLPAGSVNQVLSQCLVASADPDVLAALPPVIYRYRPTETRPELHEWTVRAGFTGSCEEVDRRDVASFRRG